MVAVVTEANEAKVEQAAATFDKGLEDVVGKIANLAKRYDGLPEEIQDKILSTVHNEKAFVYELIILVLRRWPMMP